jgi:hypothetical protein
MRQRKQKSKKHKSRRYNSGGSSLLELLVPGGLFAASEFMKRRSNKHVRSRSYLVNSNKTSRKRRKY